MNILFIDDDPQITEAVEIISMLNPEYDITTTTNPLEGLDLFKNNSYDLVVTDQSMPNMEGTELMFKIKEIKQSVPVVVVSGYTIEQEDSSKPWFDKVYVKPILDYLKIFDESRL